MEARLAPHNFIGVFDSGVGGMSVLKHLVAQMPHEEFHYFGDSAFAPYGTKPKAQIAQRSLAIAKKFIDEGAKALVIACNTATAAAADELRATYSHVPIVGVEPALKPAVTAYPHGTVVVLATKATLSLQKYHNLESRLHPSAKVISIPGEGLVELIESGQADSEQMHKRLTELLGNYTGQVDAVVLGCTHYPFIKKQISSVLGDVEFFDGGAGAAHQLRRLLEQKNLLASAENAADTTVDVAKKAGIIEPDILFSSSIDTPEELDFYQKFFSQDM